MYNLVYNRINKGRRLERKINKKNIKNSFFLKNLTNDKISSILEAIEKFDERDFFDFVSKERHRWVEDVEKNQKTTLWRRTYLKFRLAPLKALSGSINFKLGGTTCDDSLVLILRASFFIFLLGGTNMAFQRPKGTNDILPGVSEKWQFIEETARLLFHDYRFSEIRTPSFEHYEVIARSVGDTTDIVSKEMYDFYDKGNRHVTLRPEGTAPIVRAYVENKLYGPEYPKPYKMYYIEPMFRYERPQAGRLRQFHQIGVEVFGSENPAVDVETMAMALDYFKQLGIQHIQLVINSLGDKESRQAYRAALISFLEAHLEELSEDSKRRLHENPLRVLDSKDEKDKQVVANAPKILDYLNEASQKHFQEVKDFLTALNIPFVVDSNMVRGLDYYNHTIFEIMSDAPGFKGVKTTVCGGGRYDSLVEELGGPHTPAFGFGMGMERLLITLEAEDVQLPTIDPLDCYVVSLGEATNLESLKIVQTIRNFGYSCDRDYLNRKAKAQFKTAAKENAQLVITIGENELQEEKVNVKHMASGKEVSVPLQDIYENFNQVFDELTTPIFEN